jgi:hypothetical protein
MSCRSAPRPDPNQNCLVCPMRDISDNFENCPPWCVVEVQKREEQQAQMSATWLKEVYETARIAEESFQ